MKVSVGHVLLEAECSKLRCYHWMANHPEHNFLIIKNIVFLIKHQTHKTY